MKKLIVSAAALMAAVAFASVESDNTFGILKVPADASGQTFLSVPWVTVGSNVETIDAEKLVLASELANGDSMLVYAGSTFKGWTVVNGAWQAGEVSVKGRTDPYGGAEDTDGTVARGAGLVVQTAKSDIYLCGQYSPAAATVTVAANGYTLLGTAFAEPVNLNTGVTWSAGRAVGDEIITGSATFYYDGTNWVQPATAASAGAWQGNTTVGVELAAGRAAWYHRKGSGEVTMTFPAKTVTPGPGE